MNDTVDPQSDALERFIAAYQPGTFAPTTNTDRWSDQGVAAALLDLAATLHPAGPFADGLDQRLAATDAQGAQAAPTANGSTEGEPAHLDPRAHDRHLRRVPVWTAIAATILLSLVLFAPQVRASLQALWQIGVVHIVRSSASPPSSAGPTSTPLASLLDLSGQTTLANARKLAGFPIRLPSYPSDLGQPDLVYLQNLDGPMVVLVWLVPGHPNQVRMSLHELSSSLYVEKFAPPVLQTTSVQGQAAVWTDGPYPVVVRNGSLELRRLITGHVLIWTEGSITYRLETSVSLPEAVRIAESLH